MDVVLIVVSAPVIPCVGVTFSGHRILDWEWVEFDEYLMVFADIEGFGFSPYSYFREAVLIEGVWHSTKAVPFLEGE